MIGWISDSGVLVAADSSGSEWLSISQVINTLLTDFLMLDL